MIKPCLVLLFCCTMGSLFFSGLHSQNSIKNQFNDNSQMIAPPYLKSGDTVAIVAPSGILKNRQAEINRAVKLLESWGLHASLGEHIYRDAYHFAGTDDQRCEDFQNALNQPHIKAIWCARGGYGAVRIIDKLDFTRFKSQPKWIIGYSDITAIHNVVHNLNIQSIHGMMCTSLSDNFMATEASKTSLKHALFGKALTYDLKGSKYNKEGEAKGILVGGNLTLLQNMLGSSSSISTAGKIVFIEEIGEYKYHIDRLLQSLKRAGYFNGCKGVLVGDFTKIKRNTTSWGTTTEQLILDALDEYNFPIAFNMPAGHENDNRALVLGAHIKLKVEKSNSELAFLK